MARNMQPRYHALTDLSAPRYARRVSRVWGVICALAVLLAARVASADGAPRVRTALYYGKDLPAALVEHFERVVVEADHFATAPRGRAQIFAYVSVGEVNRSRPWHKDVPRSLFIGENTGFGTDIVDTTSAEWHKFLLDRVIEPLYAHGFRGVFFDTLDSFRRVPGASPERHTRGIADLILASKRRHPDMKILVNRGFDVLPLAAQAIDGLIVESLFATFGASGRYRDTTRAEADALLAKLAEVRAKWPGMPITVVDYAEPSRRRAVAQRISAAGFDPWVTSPALDEIGVGGVEIVPRKVLLLYKGDDKGYLGEKDACVLVAPVLEWLGYAVDYHDVRRPFPTGSLRGTYAGIVAYVPEGVDEEGAYRAWLLTQLDAGVRVAFLGGFGLHADATFLKRLGLTPAIAEPQGKLRVTVNTPFVGLEAPPRARQRDRPPVIAPDSQTLLRLEDASRAKWDAVVVGPWGGVAFTPYMLEERLDDERRWILDPFRFLFAALALPTMPAPDVTTESGRRILTVHIDGDGFVSRAERRGTPYTAEVILNEILARYPIPHTISVVEGEVGPKGMYPSESPRLEAIARDIFRLPNVEIASHTFSHPFEWADAEAGHKEPLPHLPIAGYTFDLERDLKGSIDYINSRLAPPGKRVRMLLWSGDCSPSARAVAMADALGVYNVNGGGGTRTRDTPSLTRGSALGIPQGNAYQVFAPVENENVYTNDWHGPFYGYRHATETFELNDRPRRLSILTIYYHFYSAAKTASLVALKEVYDWAALQETTPLYLSEYAARVLAFQKVTMARRIDDGAWEAGALGELGTLRLDPAWGPLDLARSQGVAGVRESPQGRYVTVVPGAHVVLVPGTKSSVYLESANGRVLKWEAKGSDVALRVAGHVPLAIAVGGAARPCTLRTKRGALAGTRAGSLLRFALPTADTGEATLECR
jgi:hypothetical protein